MTMAMMHIRQMPMRMNQTWMRMKMLMRFWSFSSIMFVLMVLIMDMQVRMSVRLVCMLVLMTFTVKNHYPY